MKIHILEGAIEVISSLVQRILNDIMKNDVTEVEIPEGVTRIGDFAFAGCSSLTQINIPESVNEIGGRSFEGCTSLIQVTIPEGVTVIGEGAFDDCTT